MVTIEAECAAESLVSAFADCDLADCRRSRTSTSGGVLTVGSMAVKTWSSTQGSSATSIGEAEYDAPVRGAAEASGLAVAMRDFGGDPKIRPWVDSSAAMAVAGRLGLQRTRLVKVRFLRLQEVARQRRLTLCNIRGGPSPVDALTKPKPLSEPRAALGRETSDWWQRSGRCRLGIAQGECARVAMQTPAFIPCAAGRAHSCRAPHPQRSASRIRRESGHRTHTARFPCVRSVHSSVFDV